MAYQRTMSAHVAGVGRNPTANMRPAVSLDKELQQKKSTVMTKTKRVASIAANFLGAPGAVVGFGLDRSANSDEENNQLDVLAKHYSTQVRVILGLPSERKVTRQDLLMAANMNKELAAAIKPVQDEKKRANRANLVAAGAVAAVGGIPGVSGITSLGAKLVVHGGTDMGARVIYETAAKHHENYTVHEATLRIDAKMAEGVPVTAADVVLIQLAKNVQWQKAFKKQHHKGFNRLSDEEKLEVVQTMPDLLVASESTAQGLNSGSIQLQSLALQQVASESDSTAERAPGSWASKIQGERRSAALQGQSTATDVLDQPDMSYAERERVRREIAARGMNGIMN